MPVTHTSQRSLHASNRIAQHRSSGSALLLQFAARPFLMKMSLQTLVRDIPGLTVPKGKDVQINGLALDSRRVGQGSLFFALPGLRTDGALYIAEAIERGASAIVSSRDCWVPPGVVLLRSDDVRGAMGRIAARFYGDPADELELTGCMGTSGKTVITMLARHFLEELGPCGLLGTIQYGIGQRTLPAHRTTPEPIELHALLAQMRSSGCRRTLMEVSAHGIDQGRVAGLRFKRLILANLTPEHLNYHGSFERYVEKQRTFIEGQLATLECLILGTDDPQVRQLADSWAAAGVPLIRFGLDADADIRAEQIVYSTSDTRFKLITPEGRWQCVSPLLGEFNLQNLLAAFALCRAEGMAVESMVARLLPFPGVRGRMEQVQAGQKPAVIIDYMHTEAAYRKGLQMVRTLGHGRLITVFGCGGNRDPQSRPAITRIVCELADVAIATADNPRHETVEAIFADMRRGNEAAGNLRFIGDRQAAIAEAIRLAAPEDTVLIAGKGHEAFQEFADCVVPFDDKVVARNILHNQRWYSS